jgi:hypothetical protein
MKNLSIVIVSMVLLGGCAVEDAPASNAQGAVVNEEGAGFRADLQHIQGALMSGRPSSLCWTIRRHTGGAGLYRVVSMESFMEPQEELKRMHPKTYVQLERLEAWSVDAPRNPVARINGGVYPDGGKGGFIVTLTVGEKVGVLLDAPTPENLGFYSMHQEGVFNENGGRYTNDRLFTQGGKSVTELAEMVSKRADVSFDECAKDDVVSDIGMMDPHLHEDPSDKPQRSPVIEELVANEMLGQ